MYECVDYDNQEIKNEKFIQLEERFYETNHNKFLGKKCAVADLGQFADYVGRVIIEKNKCPGSIIGFSRSGMHTIPHTWSRIWRGPSVVVNAGLILEKHFLP
eukprot:UN02323